MVLIVGDAVLDNLTEAIGPMRYEVVRMQSAGDPDVWETSLKLAGMPAAG